MKISKFKQALSAVLIAIFFCVFVQTCFSQEQQPVEKAEQRTVAQEVVELQEEARHKASIDQKINLQHKINVEKIKRAITKRKSFLATGGFWGFFVWILLLLNTILFISAAIITWCFIRRHRTYPKELVHRVKTVLYDGELGFAMEACSSCSTPLGRILFSAFKNVADGFEVCKDEMNIALKAEYERMLKTTRLLFNCAIYSFVLGFLGSGMIIFYALKHFATNSAISNWQQLAYSCSQSFYPLMTGLIIAYIAFWFYQYCLGKINRIIINTEKIAYDLIKVLRGINLEDDLPDLPTMTRLLNPRSIVSLPKNKISSKKDKAGKK